MAALTIGAVSVSGAADGAAAGGGAPSSALVRSAPVSSAERLAAPEEAADSLPSLSGTVTTPEGDVVAGVDVTATSDDGTAVTVPSGLDGEFEFRDLPVGEYEIVADVADADTAQAVVVDDGGPEPVMIVGTPTESATPGSIEGDLSGDVDVDVTDLVIVAFDGAGQLAGFSEVGSDSSYAIDGLTPADYTVSAVESGAGTRSAPVSVSVVSARATEHRVSLNASAAPFAAPIESSGMRPQGFRSAQAEPDTSTTMPPAPETTGTDASNSAPSTTVPAPPAPSTTLPTPSVGQSAAPPLSGQVTRFDTGVPLAGISVTACETGSGTCEVTSTDSGGLYAFAALPQASYTLAFDGTLLGFALQYFDGAEAPESAAPVEVGSEPVVIDAALSVSPRTIAGVITADGLALEGVEVVGCSSGGVCSLPATTDANGKYLLSELTPGDYVVTATAPPELGYLATSFGDVFGADSAVPVTVEADGPSPADIDIALLVGGVIAGTVDAVTVGNPLADVQVLVCSTNSPRCSTAVTDTVGSYSVVGLEPDEYVVRFVPPTTVHLSEYFEDSRYIPNSSRLLIGVGETLGGIDAQLELGGFIGGRVTDEAGDPVGGISVQACRQSSSSSPCESATTDVNGEYLLSGLVPGAHQVVFAFGESDFVRQVFGEANGGEVELVAVVAAQVTDGIDVSLAAAGYIEGMVTGVGGVTLDYAWVSVCSTSTCASAWTDVDGFYRIGGLAADDYLIRFSGPSPYADEYFDDADRNDATPVSVVPGQTSTINGELDLGGSISGKVTDVDGNGLSARVIIRGPSTSHSLWTATDGTYSYARLRGGEYTVEFEKSGFISEFFDDTTVEDFATPVVVVGGVETADVDAILEEAAPLGSMSGTVTGPSGALLDNVHVRACPVAGNSSGCRSDWTWDGAYTISDLAPGEYVVSFEPHGGGSNAGLIGELYLDVGVFDVADAVPVMVAAGETTTGVDASLGTGGGLAGTVTDTSGVPVANVKVSACPKQSSPRIGVPCETEYTLTDGTYQIEGLYPIDYTVAFEPPSRSGLSTMYYDGALDLDDAQAVPVELGVVAPDIDAVLPVAASVSGTITDSAGNPVVGAQVSVCPEFTNRYWCISGFGGGRSAVTAADGTYRVSPLQPGRYWVLVDPPAESGLNEWYSFGADDPWSADVISVSLGTAAIVDAALLREAAIQGTVTDAGGIPVADVAIYVCGGGTCYSGITTEADGTYRLTGLNPASYTVRFTPPDGSPLMSEYFDNVELFNQATLVDVEAEQQVSGIDAQLDVGGSIAGSVTDSNGNAVEDVVASACSETGGGCRFATTAADGTYQIDGLRTGSYRVSFAPPWGSELLDGEYSADASGVPSSVDVIQEETTAGIDIQLEVGGVITGAVTDGVDPVSGVSVRACGPDGCSSDSTGVDGVYRIVGLEAGRYSVFFNPGNASPFVREWFDGELLQDDATLIDVVPGGEYIADASLVRRGSISGVVTSDVNGEGVRNVNVQACLDIDQLWDCSDAMTAADGSYVVDGLIPGPYRVRFFAPYNSPLVGEYYDDTQRQDRATLVMVESATDTPGIGATLRTGGSISGTVLADDTGLPLSGVYVSVCGNNSCGGAQSDANGDYLIVGLASGPHTVRFNGTQAYQAEYFDNVYRSSLQAEVAVDWGIETLDIDASLARFGMISGRVTGDGAPDGVAGVRVNACNNSSWWWGECPSAITAGDGSYSISGVAVGTVRLSFDPSASSGFAPGSGPSVTMGPAETVVVDHSLELMGSLSGTVTVNGAAPTSSVRSGLRVRICEVDGSCVTETLTSAGAWSYPASPGRYTVRFSDTAAVLAEDVFDGADAWSPTVIEVASGEDISGIDGDLTTGSVIEGTILDANGDPLATARLSLCLHRTPADEDQCEYVRGAETASDGTYRLVGVSPAVYSLRVRPSWGQAQLAAQWYGHPDVTPIVVGPGTTISGIDVQLFESSTISGRITAIDQPGGVGDAWVEACPDGFEGSEEGCLGAVTDAAGAYEIAVPAGEHYVYAGGRARGYSNQYFAYSAAEGAAAVLVTEGENATDIDIELLPRVSISGTATYADGGAAADVAVTVRCTSGPRRYQCSYGTQTDPDGSYTINGLDAGAYRVLFDPEGPYARQYFDGVSSPGSATVVVAAGTPLTGIDAELTIGGSFSGVVSSVMGDPVGQLSIEVCPAGSTDPADCFVESVNGGLYSVVGIPAGTYDVEFSEWCSYDDDCLRLAPARTQVTVVDGADTPDIDVTMDRRPTVSGTVRATNGGGLSKAYVEFCSTTVDTCNGVSTRADGTYDVSWIEPGEYTVEFQAPPGSPFQNSYLGGATAPEASETFVLSAGADVTNVDGELSVPGGSTSTLFDFDGDGRADRAIFRLLFGGWYIDAQETKFLGLSSDQPVPADYDGDGVTDAAVFRDGAWFIEGQPTRYLGAAGDIPVPADYDGDGAAEVAVYRDGAWYIEGQDVAYFGAATDIPVPADFDGDGMADRAVYRPAIGGWYVEGQETRFYGMPGDVPIPADFDGDGDADPAVYRPQFGGWYVLGMETQFVGLSSDVPVPADYDGDGAAERAVFRPEVGGWYVEGEDTRFYGLGSDLPVLLPAAIYDRFYSPL